MINNEKRKNVLLKCKIRGNRLNSILYEEIMVYIILPIKCL